MQQSRTKWQMKIRKTWKGAKWKKYEININEKMINDDNNKSDDNKRMILLMIIIMTIMKIILNLYIRIQKSVIMNCDSPRCSLIQTCFFQTGYQTMVSIRVSRGKRLLSWPASGGDFMQTWGRRLGRRIKEVLLWMSMQASIVIWFLHHLTVKSTWCMM